MNRPVKSRRLKRTAAAQAEAAAIVAAAASKAQADAQQVWYCATCTTQSRSNLVWCTQQELLNQGLKPKKVLKASRVPALKAAADVCRGGVVRSKLWLFGSHGRHAHTVASHPTHNRPHLPCPLTWKPMTTFGECHCVSVSAQARTDRRVLTQVWGRAGGWARD